MKQYRIIYADPPWWMGGVVDSADNVGKRTRSAPAKAQQEAVRTLPCGGWYDADGKLHGLHTGCPYPQMKTEDICALPIRDIAEKDATLFMWTTTGYLMECNKVIEAWGFKYKHCLVWDKVRHNVSPYSRCNCEYLIVAGRGKSKPDIVRGLPHTVQVFDKGPQNGPRSLAHSQKPEWFAIDYIDKFWPEGNRIELFARRARPGWDVWGNEAPDSIELFETTKETN